MSYLLLFLYSRRIIRWIISHTTEATAAWQESDNPICPPRRHHKKFLRRKSSKMRVMWIKNTNKCLKAQETQMSLLKLQTLSQRKAESFCFNQTFECRYNDSNSILWRCICRSALSVSAFGLLLCYFTNSIFQLYCSKDNLKLIVVADKTYNS